MTFELPVLRLGLAGFSSEQKEQVGALLSKVAPASVAWEIAPFADADAWWLCGARTQMVSEGTIRVAPGMPAARSVQLSLPEVDRPVAFSLPVASHRFEPGYTFDLAQPASMAGILTRFSAWLQPMVCQFYLAASILRHQTALGTGTFQVEVGGQLIAVVDMRGAIALWPSAGPPDFEDAMWHRCSDAPPRIPEHFMRTDLSQIMWQYAMRTRRDVLPAHYRTQPVYFRRPPRLSQRVLRDAHLLLLRELAAGPGTFDELALRTKLTPAELASHLQALYLVGSVTSNAKRAGAGASIPPRPAQGPEPAVSGPSQLSSMYDTRDHSTGGLRADSMASDMTAPAPLLPR